MKYKLSQKRRAFLENHFFEFTFNQKIPDIQVFDSLTEPIELHYIADRYNWDDGIEVLNWIVNSPICDKGTAKLIFWRSQPSYYIGFENEAEAGVDLDGYSLLKNIVRNIESGFYKTENIFYDPRQDIDAESPDGILDEQENIPEYMKTEGKGRLVSFDLGVADYIKYRKLSNLKIDVKRNEDMLLIPALNLNISLISKWQVADNNVFLDFISKHHFPTNVKAKYLSTSNQLKKAIFPPITLLQSDSKYILLYAFFRKGMTGDTLINVANLVRFDIANVGAFVDVPQQEGMAPDPRRMKVGGYRAALSEVIAYDFKTPNGQTEKYEMYIFYVDQGETICAFYLFSTASQPITKEDIDSLTERMLIFTT